MFDFYKKNKLVPTLDKMYLLVVANSGDIKA